MQHGVGLGVVAPKSGYRSGIRWNESMIVVVMAIEARREVRVPKTGPYVGSKPLEELFPTEGGHRQTHIEYRELRGVVSVSVASHQSTGGSDFSSNTHISII